MTGRTRGSSNPAGSSPPLRVSVFAVVALLVAACSPGATATPTTAPTAADPPAGTPTGTLAATPTEKPPTADVTFITDFLLWGWHSPYFAAQEEGFFDDEALNVEIIAGSGSVNTATQLATGNVDFGLIDIATALRAMSEGAEFQLIGVYMQRHPGGFLFIQEETQIEDWDDFEGLTIGGSPNDAYFTSLPGLMRENGADPAQYTLVEMEPASTTGALISGQVDAIPGSPMTSPPRAAAAAAEGLTLDRFGFSDNGYEAVGFALATTKELYENDKALVQRFVNAWAHAIAWSLQNRDDAVQHFIDANPEKVLEQERESLENAAELMPDADGTLFQFPDERMQYTIDFVNDTYDLSFDGSEVYTNEFIDELPEALLRGELP